MTRRVNKFEQSPKGLGAITAGLRNIFYLPVRSFIIILIVSVSLFLAIVSYLFGKNITSFYENWNKSVEITVYLKKEVGSEKADDFIGELQSNKIIADLELIRPDDGMKMFVENTSLTSLLSSFDDNPLPNVIRIYPKIKDLSKDKGGEFIQMIKDRSEVELVRADLEWMEQSHRWLNLFDKLTGFFIFILALNALFVLCGMSFAMTSVFREKDHLSKIVLQYQFAFYGLIGSLVALVLTRVCLLILEGCGIHLSGLGFGVSVCLIFGSAFLSLISSRMFSS